MKIALYSCNFGNYRDEFKYYYNTIFDDKIDYFLFTDKLVTRKEIVQLNKWNIYTIPTLPSDRTMDRNRWTSKHVKFIVPKQLRDYDILIWVDSKRFIENDKMNHITYEEIITILDKYPNHDVFNVKHRLRNTIQEEILETRSIGLENINSANHFLKVLTNYVSTFSLPDTCVIIRKNNQRVNNAFEYCFQLMKKYKLKRDQNVYNFGLDSNNITPIILNYNDLSSIC